MRLGKTLFALVAVGVAVNMAMKAYEDEQAVKNGILSRDELKYEKEIEREYRKNKMKRRLRSLGK